MDVYVYVEKTICIGFQTSINKLIIYKNTNFGVAKTLGVHTKTLIKTKLTNNGKKSQAVSQPKYA